MVEEHRGAWRPGVDGKKNLDACRQRLGNYTIKIE
jgi:hypothetical protein